MIQNMIHIKKIQIQNIKKKEKHQKSCENKTLFKTYKNSHLKLYTINKIFKTMFTLKPIPK